MTETCKMRCGGDLASEHISKARIAACVAAVLGVASFVVSFTMASVIFSETRTIWKELDNEISEFESISHGIWKDVSTLAAIRRHNRQAVERQDGGFGFGVDTSNGGIRGLLRSWAFAPLIEKTPANVDIRQPVLQAERSTDYAAGSVISSQSGAGSATSGCNCGNADKKCPPGPPGPPGPRGDAGLDGVSGIDGKPGFDAGSAKTNAADENCQVCPALAGNVGTTGPPGPRGMKGSDGNPGISAKDGHPGTPGDPGSVGAPGVVGNPGAKGPPGKPVEQVKGVKGAKGPPGPLGPAGDKGPSGINGQRGTPGGNGPIGEPGHRGKAGENGEQGRQGFHGDAPPDGKYCPCPDRGSVQPASAQPESTGTAPSESGGTSLPGATTAVPAQATSPVQPIPESNKVQQESNGAAASLSPGGATAVAENPVTSAYPSPGTSATQLPSASAGGGSTAPSNLATANTAASAAAGAALPGPTGGYVLADSPVNEELSLWYK